MTPQKIKKMTSKKINILFRKPVFPVIVISEKRLLSSFNVNELADSCAEATSIDNDGIIKVIDSTGEEFWYSIEHCGMSPGLCVNKWTKKKIICLYNETKEETDKYSEKSLSAKKLERIIKDICVLLKS